MVRIRRCNKSIRKRPKTEPAFSKTPEIEWPKPKKSDRKRLILTIVPISLIAIFSIYKMFWVEPVELGENEGEVEMEEVSVVPPKPEPESEPEPEPETNNSEEESEPDLSSALLAEDNTQLGPPGPQLSMDLALGSGADGMAVGGAGGRGGAGPKGGRFTYEAGQADKDPVMQAGRAPQIPKAAKDKGVSGSFEAFFVVNAQGRVEALEVKGSPQGFGFEDEIRKALRSRRYRPAEAGGVPVPMKLAQVFDFTLE